MCLHISKPVAGKHGMRGSAFKLPMRTIAPFVAMPFVPNSFLLLVVRPLLLLANIVTTSKALVTRSDALCSVRSVLLLLVVRPGAPFVASDRS